jgi:putative spermidine/putrescine transport system permease protein
MLRRFVDLLVRAFLPLVSVCVIVLLYAPTLIAIIMSFDPRGFAANFPPVGFTLKWYVDFLNNSSLILGLRTSLILGLIAVGLSLLFAVPCAYMFARHDFKGKGLLSTFFLSPLIVPAVVTGVGLLTFFSAIGFLNAFPDLIIAHTVIGFPYVFRVVLASSVGLDRSVEEASLSLGASKLETFGRVTIPTLTPALVAAATVTFAVSLDDIGVSVFLVSPSTYTLPVALFTLLRASFTPVVAAASTFLMIGTFVAIVGVEKSVGLDRLLALY